MSLAQQKECGCILGKDYPLPIVDHDEAKKECMEGMKRAFAERRGEKEAIKDKKSNFKVEKVIKEEKTEKVTKKSTPKKRKFVEVKSESEAEESEESESEAEESEAESSRSD